MLWQCISIGTEWYVAISLMVNTSKCSKCNTMLFVSNYTHWLFDSRSKLSMVICDSVVENATSDNSLSKCTEQSISRNEQVMKVCNKFSR